MKIVCTDIASVSKGDLDVSVLERYGEVTYYDVTPAEKTAERIKDAECVLVNKTVIGKAEMDAAPNLKYIGIFATGYNIIDTDYARERGITVCNAGQYSTCAVTQHTFALILEIFSRVGSYDETVRRGDWKSSSLFTMFKGDTDELFGKTLGIVGYGSIGRAVAEAALAFGMNVAVSTRTPKKDDRVRFVSFDELLSLSDVISFHCPLTESTRGMLDGDAIAKCRDGVIVINTSRGPVIDENALAAALKSGKVAAAGLDVLAAEPMAKDCPLHNIENCIITPHIAWAPLATRKRLLSIVTDNIEAYLAGSPKNKVN